MKKAAFTDKASVTLHKVFVVNGIATAKSVEVFDIAVN